LEDTDNVVQHENAEWVKEQLSWDFNSPVGCEYSSKALRPLYYTPHVTVLESTILFTHKLEGWAGDRSIRNQNITP
jgi:hypothetical protein